MSENRVYDQSSTSMSSFYDDAIFRFGRTETLSCSIDQEGPSLRLPRSVVLIISGARDQTLYFSSFDRYSKGSV